MLGQRELRMAINLVQDKYYNNSAGIIMDYNVYLKTNPQKQTGRRMLKYP